jgi:hypothetical protein
VGGWTTTVVAFLFMFDFSTFPEGLEKAQNKSKCRKIAARKNATRQGSISVEPGLADSPGKSD